MTMTAGVEDTIRDEPSDYESEKGDYLQRIAALGEDYLTISHNPNIVMPVITLPTGEAVLLDFAGIKIMFNNYQNSFGTDSYSANKQVLSNALNLAENCLEKNRHKISHFDF